MQLTELNLNIIKAKLQKKNSLNLEDSNLIYHDDNESKYKNVSSFEIINAYWQI